MEDFPTVFTYSEHDLLKKTSRYPQEFRELSKFDKSLQHKWQDSSDKGHFRYRLELDVNKVLPGRFGFIAELNENRATNRRAPEDITRVSQPFDHNKFNFTKARDIEFLFEVVKVTREKKNSNENSKSGDFLMINVSPFEFCSSLLLPSMHDCLPQVMTVESLKLAIEVLMLSATPSMRAGFNSLCGFASINHLHFHIYYLRRLMLLEYIEVGHLAGPCYELVDYPARGFVFQLSEDRNIEELASYVHRLTNFLHCSNVGHNVCLTRGTRLESKEPGGLIDGYDTVRVYVWARESSSGTKDVAAFNPALCEFFGYFNIKNAQLYDGITEDYVAKILRDTCDGPFKRNRGHVKKLFDSEPT